MNYKQRTKDVDGILIHSMGEFVGGLYAPDFLMSIGLSAHFFITHRGEPIRQVPIEKVSFHAGKSKWKDQTNLNETFIGIELMIQGDHSWATFVEAIKKPESFTDLHYKTCAIICNNLMGIHEKITFDRILKHSQVSGADVRNDPKIDPGSGFSMERLIKEIKNG